MFLFEVAFGDQFRSDFYRFLLDLWRVWGGQNGRNIDIFVVLGGMLRGISFLVNFHMIFDKIHAKKHMKIWFFICCFIICMLNLLFSLMLETLKIVILPKENAYFYEISFFVFDVQGRERLPQKQWVGRATGSQKSMKFECQHLSKNHWQIDGFRGQNSRKLWKKGFPKPCFFSHAFLKGFWKGLGKVLEGLGEGFGTSWTSLGTLLSIFFKGFVAKRPLEMAKGPLGFELVEFTGVWGRI